MMTRCSGSRDLFELPVAAQAFALLQLGERTGATFVWVSDGPKSMDVVGADLQALSQEPQSLISYPASDPMATTRDSSNRDIEGERITALASLQEQQSISIITTTAEALLQTVIAPADLRKCHLSLEVGSKADPEELSQQLSDQGYTFTPEVQEKGEASLRGGIIDLWPPAREWPARIEFFGSEVESIRLFSPTEQRSIEKLEGIDLTPPSSRPLASGKDALLLDYLPSNTVWIWEESPQFREHIDLAQETEDIHWNWQELLKEIKSRFKLFPSLGDGKDALAYQSIWQDIEPVEQLSTPTEGGLEPDLLENHRQEYFERLETLAARDMDVQIYFYTEGSEERFKELYGERIDFERFEIHQHYLSQGFISESHNLVIVAESDLCGYSREFPTRRVRQRKRYDRRKTVERIQTWTELQPGDLVVHVDCGVGRYLGLYEIESRGKRREMLAVEYADEAKLYVPPDHAHLLSRYVGMGRQAPKLHKLGGAKWDRDKASAEKSIEDLAASMLKTQAERETVEGTAFQKDTHWQNEFENGFPFQETADQQRAIDEVKRDMESPKPMDRLLCGDVGYGKTEVAMRAAFKAVMSGYQVAILVPTTVLAQQHYETFSARMDAFPVSVEMLSRFRSRGRQSKTLERMESGEADIVIGTHRLVQADISFKNLGLVIIDEEQRFGVKHKEKLKHLRSLVDVLTMTATPIPRTLYMSLAGAKDMSTIQTAPNERYAVETIVEPFSENLIRRAVLHELDREGQVYILHNRVKTIYNLYDKLSELIPEARIEVGHGQMPEKKLSDVMHRFGRGEIDVLLCTTIIESGLDIPNVNTILVDRADRFGLADLYQLRGRVGRYNRKAYAYLLLPREGRLFDTARKRIQAIQNYTSLGSGFNLALRDLEIRGAGNLLGREQSGHIAAIGFDLYCQLLHRSIAQLKGEEPPRIIDVQIRLDFLDESPDTHLPQAAAMLPYSYIEDENLRLKFYRRFAATASEKNLDDLRQELRDRFGPLPQPVENLLELGRIRILASELGINRVQVKDNRIMLRRVGDFMMTGNRFPRLEATETSDRLHEIVQLLRQIEG